MNIGSCAGCNKMIQYEKFPICKVCEDKYIKQVMDYGYKKGLQNVTMEELHDELCIPLKVLEFFEKQGLLSKDGKITEKQETEQETEEAKKQRDIETLRKIMGALEESKANQPVPKGLGVGMHTRDYKESGNRRR